MTSTNDKIDTLSKKIAEISIQQDIICNTNISEANNYYKTRQTSKGVNFARLEKGLLLFIYIHETTKSILYSEIALWDRRLCIQMIKNGDCPKLRNQCRYEHETLYRQSNICPFWYTHSCTYGTKCRFSHEFFPISNYHHYILTNTDNIVYKLIRFVRNFAGHYIDSAIKDENDLQQLHKEMVVLMVHLVHFLSPKRSNSIDHLNLFLEATTIKQLISPDSLLEELEKPYNVPKIFLESTLNFNTHWYRHGTNKCSVDFSQMSTQFITHFNSVFIGFYEGRLKSRGAPIAWA
ncbi:unnamed protein product [Rotaria sordida]|uniref:C3H1-type domain-containing protein n=1 Tax=Rotaria sordida TaxID=392033 RepID=A0A815CHB4_9BILA|nr:unnamed protein product [Rotaria sordida]